MMLYWEIFKKELTENKWIVFWFWISLIALIIMYVTMYPIFGDDTEAFEPVLEMFPPELMEVFGIQDIKEAMTFEGFISMEMLSLLWPVLIGILIFVLGRKLVAKEVDDKTGDVLFTLPARRHDIFVAKFVSYYAFVLFVSVTALATIYGGGIIIGEELDLKGFFLFFLLSGALSFFLLAFTGLFSSLFDSGGKVAGVAGGFFVASYALHVLSIMIETVEKAYFLSFFKYYGNPLDVLRGAELDWMNILVFVGVGGVLFVASLYRVSVRDL